jgi:hypothetical protein
MIRRLRPAGGGQGCTSCVADRAGARPAEAAACFDAVTDEVLADPAVNDPADDDPPTSAPETPEAPPAAPVQAPPTFTG